MKIMKLLLTGPIRAYAYLISPLMGAKCRFYPTCSAYAVDAINLHGPAKGAVMGAKRILKCHPWHRGNMIDPVPGSIDWGTIIGYNRANCSCDHKTHEVKEKTDAKS